MLVALTCGCRAGSREANTNPVRQPRQVQQSLPTEPRTDTSCVTIAATALHRERGWIRVVNCRPIENWGREYSSRIESTQETCRIGDVTLSRGKFEVGQTRSYVEATGPLGSWRREVPNGEVRLQATGFAASIGCDQFASRFYVGHPWTGEIVAYALDGVELWRRVLPEFKPLSPGAAPSAALSIADIDTQLDQGAAVGAGLVLAEPFVIAHWRTGKQYYQAVYHRSGLLIGTLGPWRLFPADSPGPRRVVYFSARPDAKTWESPREEVTLEFAEHEIDRFSRHFIAWSLPLAAHTKLNTFKVCAGLPANTIAWRLGDQFDPQLSERAKAIHDRLGPDWFVSTLGRSYGALARLIGAGDPNSTTWEEDLEHAALAAGLDADLVAELQSKDM